MKSIVKKVQEPVQIPDLMRALTPRRREMIRPVLDQPRSFVLLSLRAMSRKLKADPATLLRSVQAMGFKRYHDFQEYLHNRSIAFSTALDAMEEPAAHARGVEDLIRASLDRDMGNLKQLRSQLDPAQVVDLAQRLHRARRVMVMAGDMSSSLAYYLDYNLAMLGIPTTAALSAGEINHRVRHLGRMDVAIGITFGRGLRQTVEGLKQAQENGAYCVGVSDTFLSPAARFSDKFFIVPTEHASIADSYSAAMAMMNTILVACANVQRRRTVSILKKAAQEQRTGWRFYDSQP
jgi:DNA-binding MurR/RpiR family transcriptional regulator